MNEITVHTESTLEEAANEAFNKWFILNGKIPTVVEFVALKVTYSRYGENFKEYTFKVTE